MGKAKTNCAVFLDRDGVLNRPLVHNGRPHPPRNREELELLPGVDQACRRLKEAGLLLIMVTNQPDVSRGKQSREEVERINDSLRDRLDLDGVYVCYHDDADECPCRKPKPGMMLQAAQDRQISLTESFMVGDRWRDVEAGLKAGCETVFLDHGYREKLRNQPHRRCASLAETAEYILNKYPGSRP